MTIRASASLALLLSAAWTFACTTPSSSATPSTDAGADTTTLGAGADTTTQSGGGGGGAQVDPPRLDSLTPPRGALAGGTLVVFSGKGFANGFASGGGRAASDRTTVSFGGNPAIDVSVIDDDTIEVRSPAGARGAVDVVLTNPNGSVTCTGCFTFFEDVVAARIAPSSGATAGGDEVTVSGAGLVAGVQLLVGGQAATEVVTAADGTSLTARTPPGIAGSADVTVVGPNSASTLKRGFVYVDPVRVVSVSPLFAPVAGGLPATVSGEGFTPDAVVSFGGRACADVTVAADGRSLTAVVPAAAAAGAVELVVQTRHGRGSLGGAFAYVDGGRDVRLYAASPAVVPTAGGTCAARTGCLTLVGEGLDGEGLSVLVGSQPATLASVSAHVVTVDVPAAAEGAVSVQARTVRGGDLLANAVTYAPRLSAADVSPASAPASGDPAVQATVSGEGFSAECAVFFGASRATFIGLADGTRLTVLVPPGSPGVRDVRVECGSGASLRQATLPAAFEFTSPLRALQVDPPTGARAGGTLVTLYGSGFTSDMEVLFGTRASSDVRVVSPQQAVVRTPRGDTGLVDVVVRRPGAEHRLPAAFAYTDPTNRSGGGSGGPMRGILNVTVWNATQGMSGPVEGVTVTINDGPLSGVTDDRGQVTFSDPSLLKAVSITASAQGFAASTVARIDARNVTILMQMNDGEMGDGSPPPGPAPATVQGRVCGFKTPPGFALSPGQTLEAHVYLSAKYVYAAPPFAQAPTPFVVTGDCGTFGLQTTRFGPLAVWAEFGVADGTQTPPSFTPLLMGVRRGLTTSPGQTVEADVVLDMHRDQTVPVSVDSSLTAPSGIVVNLVYSYLDLGGEGVVPLASTTSFTNDFTFEKHPHVAGDGLLFLNIAGGLDFSTFQLAPPYSFFFRRQYGDPADGVSIGPMLAFPAVDAPSEGGVFTGSFAWHYGAGAQPDIAKLSVEQPMGLFSLPMWDVVLPGSEVRASMPRAALANLPPGTTLTWVLTSARTPRLDYDQFSNDVLYVNAWTSFTQHFGSFVTP